MKEIPITEIENIRIGQVENQTAGTGCTVLICKEGMAAGLDVRGGGPASRESELLNPLASAKSIHAVVLSGGSAFGLGAANGVMDYLEAHDIGYDVGVTKVPLVVQADIFDLTVGDPMVRPDPAMGYEAAKAAMEAPNYRDGNYGAGCGATVGKLGGMETCMKAGIGSYALQIGELKVGALIALNSLGDIFDWKNGRKIAGMLNKEKTGFSDTVELMKQTIEKKDNKFVGNTAISAVITNASFDKAALCKIASMAQNGSTRSINPVHTTADGDSTFAVSVGNVSADQDLVGTLAAEAICEAVKRAVYSAESAYGYPCAADLKERP